MYRFATFCLLVLVCLASGCVSTSTEPASSPLLLKLHGGPGQAEMATVRFNALLERDFLVVEWDQRGAGKSADVPVASLTMEQIVSDTIELCDYLLKRFQQDRLILVGHSWGSAVGLQAVHRAPGLYRAFVSTGQMANFSDAISTGYRSLLERAVGDGDEELEATLKTLGPPPYVGPDGKSRRANYIGLLEEHRNLWHAESGFDGVHWMIGAEEYGGPRSSPSRAPRRHPSRRCFPICSSWT